MKEIRKLVVFYSLEGNTKFIANAIADSLEASVLELKTKKEINAKGLTKYYWGGKQAVMKEKPALEDFSKNPEQYDMIVIGTPVWAFTFAPALRTFLSMYNLKNKKIAMFCCHGGNKGYVFDNMKNELAGNEFIGEIDFLEPLKKGKDAAAAKAAEWAAKL